MDPQLLKAVAEEHGTPCYVYSKDKIDAQCRAMRAAFPSTETQLCFAVKANPTGAILRNIFSHGFGADVVSAGELERALRAGAAAEKIVFSGVGKRDDEIRLALEKKVGILNVESADELGRIHSCAQSLGKKAAVFLRINPNIAAKTNPYIATGLYATKFGIAETQFEECVRLARSLSGLALTGISCHLGSQITDLDVFEKAAQRMVRLAEPLKKGHPEFTHLNLGGGLAVRYQDEKPPSIAAYAGVVTAAAAQAGLKLVLEPGRWLIAEAGILLTRVITVKSTPEKHFVVVDAAMNDLIRPSLYEAFHPVAAVFARAGQTRKCDVVGPVCETGDFLALDRALPPLEAGDLLEIGVCGAYGSSMASTYNSRPRAAEVWIRENTAQLIRKREPLAALWSLEV